MPRWKVNSDGSAYWDPNDDSNVNQIAPPPGATTSNTQSNPWGGSTATGSAAADSSDHRNDPTYVPPGGNSSPDYSQSGGSSPWPSDSTNNPPPANLWGNGTTPDPDGPSTGSSTPFDWSKVLGQYGYDWSSASNPGETPEQTYQRYQNDYWSPDRASVLAQMGMDPAIPKYGYNDPVSAGPGIPIPSQGSGGDWANGASAPTGSDLYRGLSDSNGDTPAPAPAPTNSAPAAGDPIGSDVSPWANPGETAGQAYERFFNDYHAPDREAILAQMRAWASGHGFPSDPANQAPPATSTTPTTSTSPVTIDYSKPAPPGFDAAKWADPSKANDPKYVAGHIIAQGGSAADVLAALNKIQPGWTLTGKDTLRDPQGNVIDFIKDEEGAHQAQWLFNPGSGSSGGVGGIQGLNAPGVAGAPAPIAGSTNLSDRNNTLWDTLMGRANQSLQVNAKDPIIANQVNAYSAQQQRAARDYLASLAEKSGPTANMNQETRLTSERTGQAVGSMQAQLIQQELTARRTEIQNALSQMGSMLSDDQRLALQQELGLIDANLRQQGITNQNNQFLDQFSLNSADRANYWDAVNRGLITG